MQVNVMRCKKRLTVLWLVGSALIFLIILFQTFFGHFNDKAGEAWSWFLPTVIPTLSLMIGVFVTDAFGTGSTKKKIDSFNFKLSLYLSIFYYIVVLLTVMMQPLATVNPVAFLEKSNLWLAPIQGLVTASLGAFFVKAEQA